MERLSQELKQLKLAIKGLTVFCSIKRKQEIKEFCTLLDHLTKADIDYENIYLSYHAFCQRLQSRNWAHFIIDLIIESEDKIPLFIAKNGHDTLEESVIKSFQRDLAILQKSSQLNSDDLLAFIESRFKGELGKSDIEIFSDELSPQQWPKWKNGLDSFEYQGDMISSQATKWLNERRESLIGYLLQANSWADNYLRIFHYYGEVGNGIFCKYAAFSWSEAKDDLEGIEKPDSIRLYNLIGQEKEQSVVKDNTEALLAGYPANNMILYGNRGTGKSSLVKALLNEYASQKLKMIQLKKSQISQFPRIVQKLSTLPYRFIVFIDDLSFNDLEQDYKELKSLLEGGVEERPANVLIYATSNRRHLVQETFSERKGDDVHVRDNMEEKLSLADRFGITVTFLTPDQQTYLEIVKGLAEQNGIDIDQAELQKRALRWVMLHNGRSGRTARQFINNLIAQIGLEKQNNN